MKISLDASQFFNAVKVAAKACPTRTPMDSLMDLKLVTSDGVMGVYGTDLNVSVSSEIVCQADADVTFCVSGQRLADILHRMDGTVTLSESTSGISLQCGRDRFRLLSADPMKHPAQPVSVPESFHEIKTESLSRALRRVQFCTDSNHSRYAYGGVAMSMDANGTCWFAASDSRRIALHTLTGKSEGGHQCNMQSTIVAPDGVRLLMGILSSGLSEHAQLHSGVSSMLACCGSVSCKLPLLEGMFPNLLKCLKPPKDGDASLTVLASELLAGVRKTMVMSEKESLAARFRATKGGLVIENSLSEVGDSTVFVDCDVNGEEASALLNVSYVSQWLVNLLADDLVRLEIPKNEMEAIKFSTDGGAYYLVSPMAEQ